MRYEQERDADSSLNLFEFLAHLLPQRRIESRQRFIEKQHLGLQNQRTGYCDTLSLPAGDLIRQAGFFAGELHESEGMLDAFADFSFAQTAAPIEAESDVLGHSEMRKQGVTLKHCADIALIGRKAGNGLSGEKDLAAGGRFESGNQAQRGGFAAAGRADQAKELAAFHIERNAIHGLMRWKMLGESAKLKDRLHVGNIILTWTSARALKQFRAPSDPTSKCMRYSKVTLATLGLPLLLWSQTASNQPPATMTKMLVRLSGPGIKPKSHSALPRTIYCAGTHYARIEDPPDARQQVEKITVIAEPDAYSYNLIDKTGTHAIDQGGPNDLHLPIVLPFDPKHQLTDLDRLEFGSEFEFFREAGATKQPGPIINAKATDAYALQTADGTATLVVKGGTETPIKLSWRMPDGEYTYEYTTYEDVPFDPQLFTKPAGIKFKEVPPDNTPEKG